MVSILHLSLYLLWRGSMNTNGGTSATCDHRWRSVDTDGNTVLTYDHRRYLMAKNRETSSPTSGGETSNRDKIPLNCLYRKRIVKWNKLSPSLPNNHR